MTWNDVRVGLVLEDNVSSETLLRAALAAKSGGVRVGGVVTGDVCGICLRFACSGALFAVLGFGRNLESLQKLFESTLGFWGAAGGRLLVKCLFVADAT
jgi:hypothetical protein